MEKTNARKFKARCWLYMASFNSQPQKGTWRKSLRRLFSLGMQPDKMRQNIYLSCKGVFLLTDFDLSIIDERMGLLTPAEDRQMGRNGKVSGSWIRRRQEFAQDETRKNFQVGLFTHFTEVGYYFSLPLFISVKTWRSIVRGVRKPVYRFKLHKPLALLNKMPCINFSYRSADVRPLGERCGSQQPAHAAIWDTGLHRQKKDTTVVIICRSTLPEYAFCIQWVHKPHVLRGNNLLLFKRPTKDCAAIKSLKESWRETLLPLGSAEGPLNVMLLPYLRTLSPELQTQACGQSPSQPCGSLKGPLKM